MVAVRGSNLRAMKPSFRLTSSSEMLVSPAAKFLKSCNKQWMCLMQRTQPGEPISLGLTCTEAACTREACGWRTR